MFAWQKDNRIYITLKDTKPVEDPEIVVGEGSDGEATIVVNGEVVAGEGITE